ncbi:MAG: TldD/PmbA family protein [Methanimicrococcus sp.]|nr:TldD/PmbA family protein [Methanimicrococcus sp.]
MNPIQYYDANQIIGRSMTIILDNGKLETISKNTSKGAGIRALCQGSWGYTSIDGETDLEVGIKNASELAISMNRNTPKERIVLGDVPKRKVAGMPQIKINPENISAEEKVELLREIEKHAKADDIKSTRVSYSETVLMTRFINSEGVEKEYQTTRCGFSVSAVAAKGNNYQAGRESRFNISGYEIFDLNNPFELAKNAADTARALLGAKTPKGGALPVILDPELAGVFTHEAVGHASEADLVLQGDSVLAGKLGKQIAIPEITVIDDPTIPEYGYYPYDAEGIPSEKTVLIQDGILNSYMHSRETAGVFDSVSGNARAQGYLMPVVRMSNTYIDRGDASFEEMIEEIKDGIYLIGSRGGQVNTGEGVFQFNAEKGYLIKNGEISDLVRDVSLSGQTLDILNQIKRVGKDLKLHAGHCGKSGQTVPVTDGAPHISIEKATVGGA